MTNVVKDLDTLMAAIEKGFAFTPEKYPAMARCSTDREARLFAIDHILKHLQKNLGAIAAQSEAADHGGPVDVEAFKTASGKIIINTFNLARILGLTPERLIARALAEFH